MIQLLMDTRSKVFNILITKKKCNCESDTAACSDRANSQSEELRIADQIAEEELDRIDT